MHFKDYQIIYIVFNADAETCIERNNKRVGRERVPENVIRNMCRDFRYPSIEEDERVIDIIEVGE
jgi:predicted kinase